MHLGRRGLCHLLINFNENHSKKCLCTQILFFGNTINQRPVWHKFQIFRNSIFSQTYTLFLKKTKQEQLLLTTYNVIFMPTSVNIGSKKPNEGLMRCIALIYLFFKNDIISENIVTSNFFWRNVLICDVQHVHFTLYCSYEIGLEDNSEKVSLIYIFLNIKCIRSEIGNEQTEILCFTCIKLLLTKFDIFLTAKINYWMQKLYI